MILITGGAGYIGSHVVKQLLDQNENIIVLDNLSTGRLRTLDTLKEIKEFIFINEDLKNFNKVEEVFKKYKIKTILHFAASIVVPESIIDPLKYYKNNTLNTTNLIFLASKYGIKKFIFSSTAAVYGDLREIPDSGIGEDFETRPINPYGMSKLMSERVIRDVSFSNKNFKYVIFRYFNVAGADMNYHDGILSPRIGECHEPETHLIPLVIKAALGKTNCIKMYGDNYNTFDGTCIRDYIHVDDLADAHIKAISYLNENESDIFNLGYSSGFSIREVINTVRKVSKFDFTVKKESRRDGDSAILIANCSKIKEKMNWQPQYDNLELICESAYRWEQKFK